MKKLILSLLFIITLSMCSDSNLKIKQKIVEQAQPGDTLYMYWMGDIIQECVVIYNKPEEEVIKLSCEGIVSSGKYETIKSWHTLSNELVIADTYDK